MVIRLWPHPCLVGWRGGGHKPITPKYAISLEFFVVVLAAIGWKYHGIVYYSDSDPASNVHFCTHAQSMPSLARLQVACRGAGVRDCASCASLCGWLFKIGPHQPP